jgi:hypothetical protein
MNSVDVIGPAMTVFPVKGSERNVSSSGPAGVVNSEPAVGPA